MSKMPKGGGTDALSDLLGSVAFPETPEERDDASNAIEAMIAAAWDSGHQAGFWNGRLSQIAIPYDAPAPDIGKKHAEATNPYRSAK